MTNNEAKSFFLKSNSYCNIDLPIYFNFQPLIDNISLKIGGKNISNFYKNKRSNPPNKFEDVNYKFLNNKDGKYSWRPFEIIHPVIYISLVQEICKIENWKIIKERFKEFQNNKKIICCSIPGESKSKKYDKKATILNWWNEFEQKSIVMSLDYTYMGVTDIFNCYSSIYTHSISWAIHTKEVAKKKENRKNLKLIGNYIDHMIQEMSFGQTNGIPQGSILMDFIAEIVLGYADELLYKELEKEKIKDYTILRYRDDYKIFTNDTYIMDNILKKLSEILSSLNLQLNSKKTFITDNIITDTIKKDKMKRIENIFPEDLNLQKQLLIIRNYGLEYPNCGSLVVLLTKFFHNKIKVLDKRPHNMQQIISILIDIMLKNPRTYAICIAILSKIFEYKSQARKDEVIIKIISKFNNIANTDYLNIWLQRLTILDVKDKHYSTPLCEKLYLDNNIWNSEWLNFEIDESLIIDNKE